MSHLRLLSFIISNNSKLCFGEINEIYDWNSFSFLKTELSNFETHQNSPQDFLLSLVVCSNGSFLIADI